MHHHYSQLGMVASPHNVAGGGQSPPHSQAQVVGVPVTSSPQLIQSASASPHHHLPPQAVVLLPGAPPQVAGPHHHFMQPFNYAPPGPPFSNHHHHHQFGASQSPQHHQAAAAALHLNHCLHTTAYVASYTYPGQPANGTGFPSLPPGMFHHATGISASNGGNNGSPQLRSLPPTVHVFTSQQQQHHHHHPTQAMHSLHHPVEVVTSSPPAGQQQQLQQQQQQQQQGSSPSASQQQMQQGSNSSNRNLQAAVLLPPQMQAVPSTHNQMQLNYLMATFRVGMLAMETLSRRVHDDRPMTKYSRNPPYGEDVKWLLSVAIKLGMLSVDKIMFSFQKLFTSFLLFPALF